MKIGAYGWGSWLFERIQISTSRSVKKNSRYIYFFITTQPAELSVSIILQTYRSHKHTLSVDGDRSEILTNFICNISATLVQNILDRMIHNTGYFLHWKWTNCTTLPGAFT